MLTEIALIVGPGRTGGPEFGCSCNFDFACSVGHGLGDIAPGDPSAFIGESHSLSGPIGGCAQCNVRLTMPQMISTLRAAGWPDICS